MRSKNKFEGRSGSALLIVLGMLSFMVVSAVGFSVYMRQGRAPSSYLTRNVAARYLVKAALANAIEDLDGGFMSRSEIGISGSSSADTGYCYGIGDDPYPGVGNKDQVENETDRDSGRKCCGGNFWFKRVFCPFGTLEYPRNKNEAISDPLETAPTLTLEALAYLPPAIIDDVRKVSRVTRTAQWKSLPYDSGRYAYTMVNVSDLMDINRLRASVARNSGRDRITLATLTSDSASNPLAFNAGRAESLDAILDKPESAKIAGNVVPFTSLADFNIAALGSAYAPLMKYIGSTSARLEQAPEVANAMFVTDTWFPSTNATDTSTSFDLGGVDGVGQPFRKVAFDSKSTSFLEVLQKINKEKESGKTVSVGEVFEKNLGIGLVCLYDYLDSDSVPISLALPTVEAVPMVVGVSAPAIQGDAQLKPQVDKLGGTVEGKFTVSGTGVADGDDTNTPVPLENIPVTRKMQRVGISSYGDNAVVQCVVCYPFKRMLTAKRIQGNDFKVRGILRVWMAPDGVGCRPASDVLLHPLKQEVMGINKTGLVKDGVATFVSDDFQAGKALNAFGQDVTKTDEAVETFQLIFRDLSVEIPLYYDVTEECGQVAGYHNINAKSDQFKASYKAYGDVNTITAALRPLTAEGTVDNRWTEVTGPAAKNYDVNQRYGVGVTEMTEVQGQYRLYAAVWVQILDRSNNVVDMVPACLADDNEWLNANVPENNALALKCGDGAPLLNFKTGTDIKFDDKIGETLSTPQSFAGWKSLYAVDPRYNWAPENWFSKDSSVATKAEWISELGLSGTSSPLLGKDGRDRDIFLFVSDQEYLQSIGELQFLAQVSRLDGNQSFLSGDFSPNYNREAFSQRTSPTTGNFASGGRFWRTYTAYERQQQPISMVMDNRNVNIPDDVDPYHMLYNNKDVVFTASGGTFKVNPYTEDDRILASALALTPFDFYIASTNELQTDGQARNRRQQLQADITADTMKQRYGFGSPNAQLSDDDLLQIMDGFREEFRSQGNTPFEEIWQDMEWQDVAANMINDENKRFLGLDLSGVSGPFHGVDRKYLYSFWRDCFANSQQLFLVFVRAEPSSIGGGAAGGVSSAQLGGRAVALVWRDPSIPSGTTGATRRDLGTIMSRDTFREMKKDQPPHRTRVLFYHQFD